MRMVTAAASQAAKRNTEWEEVASKYIIGASGRTNRRMCKIHVAFGNTTRVFYLSAGGIIFRKMGLHEYVPLDLAELDAGQLRLFRQMLARVGT